MTTPMARLRMPLARLAAAARDEAALRRRVYPRWVADGRMPQAKADARIAEMETLGDLLDALTAPASDGPLFPTPPPSPTEAAVQATIARLSMIDPEPGSLTGDAAALIAALWAEVAAPADPSAERDARRVCWAIVSACGGVVQVPNAVIARANHGTLHREETIDGRGLVFYATIDKAAET